MTSDLINISAYRFTPLADLSSLQSRVQTCADEQQLKGTVLLSAEGINLFVSGERPRVETFLQFIRTLPGLADLAAKESPGRAQPFGRMRVKIKQEIIAFGVEGIDPALRPARRVSPRTLKQWLDEGRRIVLLDTRNEYEVASGTFRGAVDPQIESFRAFPAAARQLADKLKNETVVTFCTGGIRCEKAAPFLQAQGWTDVYQLDGGILKYFEECGGDHYVGECFVFDERVGVGPDLRETGSVLCAGCQRPVTVEEQRDPRYVSGRRCPRCGPARGD